MGGGNAGNLKVADKCYHFLKENGPKTVSEMKDYLNDLGRGKGRSPRGVTSEQLANVMRCSPLFRVVGTDFISYGVTPLRPKRKPFVEMRGSRVEGRVPTDTTQIRYKKKCTSSKKRVRKRGSTAVNLYYIVPIEEVIEKLRGKKHLVRKRWPKVLKDAMKKEGII